MPDPPTGLIAVPTNRRRTHVIRLLASPGVRLAVLLTILALALLLAVQSDLVGVEALRRRFEGFGWGGPVVYVVVYAIAATMLLPASAFTIGAGLLFGPVLGTITALVGATLGAVGAFGLGRALGRQAVERLAGPRLTALDAHLVRQGFSAVLVIRLVPLFPFNVVSVSSGVTGIALRDYVLGTAIGIIPGTVAYAALGGTITSPTSLGFVGALVLFAVVTVAGGMASRRMRRRGSITPAVE